MVDRQPRVRNPDRPRRIIPAVHVDWLQVTADVYLEQRHRNRVISGGVGAVTCRRAVSRVLVPFRHADLLPYRLPCGRRVHRV
jgi:hypothetical protein